MVTVLESSSIDPATAGAVAEVYQSATGSVRVKMHDKPAALEKLARALAPVLIISSYPETESAPAASGRARDADGRAPPSKLER
jgi:hypothetical protein